jgi:hypothetical protein
MKWFNSMNFVIQSSSQETSVLSNIKPLETLFVINDSMNRIITSSYFKKSPPLPVPCLLFNPSFQNLKLPALKGGASR